MLSQYLCVQCSSCYLVCGQLSCYLLLVFCLSCCLHQCSILPVAFSNVLYFLLISLVLPSLLLLSRVPLAFLLLSLGFCLSCCYLFISSFPVAFSCASSFPVTPSGASSFPDAITCASSFPIAFSCVSDFPVAFFCASSFPTLPHIVIYFAVCIYVVGFTCGFSVQVITFGLFKCCNHLIPAEMLLLFLVSVVLLWPQFHGFILLLCDWLSFHVFSVSCSGCL